MFPHAACDTREPMASRLGHGAGVAATGHVVDPLHRVDGAETCDGFRRGLSPPVDKTAWTEGV